MDKGITEEDIQIAKEPVERSRVSLGQCQLKSRHHYTPTRTTSNIVTPPNAGGKAEKQTHSYTGDENVATLKNSMAVS